MNLENLIFHLLGGLGIFLYGMRIMSEGLQSIAGDSLRRIIGALTSNRVIAVFVGLTVTTIVQSSSVTTVMVVGFVNSGLMTLTQAIGVVLGANIGTTITGWIIAIKVTKYSLPMVGIGVLFFLFSKKTLLKNLGQILFGVGLLFWGLLVLTTGMHDVKNEPWFREWFLIFNQDSYWHILGAVFLGCLLTILVQSSTATLGITIALASTGSLDFLNAAALILGENIGTTVTAQLVAIGTNANAKRAALAHLLFNCIGVGVILLVFRHYVNFVEWLIPHSADTLVDGAKPYITVHIAATHSLFNIVNVLIFMPLIPFLARLVTFLIPEKEKRTYDPYKLKVVDPIFIESPVLGIEQAHQMTLQMGTLVSDSLVKSQSLFLDEKDPTKIREDILRSEKIVDEHQRDITLYLAKVMEANLTHEQSNEVRSLIRIADELESVSDYCESLARYKNRCIKEKITFSQAAIKDIVEMQERTCQYFQKALDAYKNSEVTYITQAKVAGNEINDFADSVRDAHLERMNKNLCNPYASLVFSDVMVALRRIKNHTFNIVEATAGLK